MIFVDSYKQASGWEAKSWFFDYTNGEYITTDNSVAYNVVSPFGSFTFSIWAYLTNTPWGGANQSYLSGGAGSFGVFSNSLILNWQNPDIVNTTVGTLNLWTQFVVTYNSGTNQAYMYVNNLGTVNQLPVNTYASGTRLWSIGRVGNTFVGSPAYFSGYMADLAAWDFAMSSGEVTTLYNSGNMQDLRDFSTSGNMTLYITAHESSDGASGIPNFGTLNNGVTGTDFQFVNMDVANNVSSFVP